MTTSRTINKLKGSGGGSMSGSEIVSAINAELGNTSWQSNGDSMSNAEIKTGYEANPNTNAFNDAYKSKSDKAIVSDASGIAGASEVLNTVVLSQADYDNLTSKDPNTIYRILKD